jgi:hypothetical protein
MVAVTAAEKVLQTLRLLSVEAMQLPAGDNSFSANSFARSHPSADVPGTVLALGRGDPTD